MTTEITEAQREEAALEAMLAVVDEEIAPGYRFQMTAGTWMLACKAGIATLSQVKRGDVEDVGQIDDYQMAVLAFLLYEPDRARKALAASVASLHDDAERWANTAPAGLIDITKVLLIQSAEKARAQQFDVQPRDNAQPTDAPAKS